MDGWKPVVAALAGVVVAGCSRPVAPPFPEWSVHTLPAPPQASSSNAFDAYALAAQSVERTGGKYLDRVFFTQRQRETATAQIGPGLALVAQGASKTCAFPFLPNSPFQAPPYQRGWRLLGRALVWKIEAAVAIEDFPKAVQAAVLATTFAFDLCGGGATDASLGICIADEARKAIAPALDQLQRKDLAALAEGLAQALRRKPLIEQTIKNEERNMMAAIQEVQDAYRIGTYDALAQNLGNDVSKAIEYLKAMQSDDLKQRPAYFQGFADEAEAEAQWTLSQAAVSASERSNVPKPVLAKVRPWKRFAHHFFETLRPLLGMDDRTVARTKLLILEATISRAVRGNRGAPKSLGDFPTWLTTDPYSGKPFVYRSDGPDYDVYSVGTNFRDDGGETDETFTSPDLRSESGRR